MDSVDAFGDTRTSVVLDTRMSAVRDLTNGL